MRSILFLLNEFRQSLIQNRYLHFTHGAQVTGSLIVVGVFFLILVWAVVFWNKLGEGLEIHVFLDDNLSARQKIRVEEDLAAIANVKSITYRSKQEALEQFSKMSHGIPVEDLRDNNPLPDSYIVQSAQPRYITEIAAACDQISGVYDVRYGQEIVEKYLKVVLIVSLVSLATLILLLVFTFSTINNIIALSVYARRTEIRIMQLVGATWWFIRWPFLFEGVFIGLIGACVSMGVVWLLMSMMSQALKGWQLNLILPGIGLGEWEIYLGMALLMLVLGICVGFAGSLRTVNSFLKREGQAQLDALRVKQLVR